MKEEDILNRLKPLFTRYLHDARVAEYEAAYKTRNNGSEPSKEQVDQFIAIMIASGNIPKEVDELIADCKKALSKKYRVQSLVFNTTFAVPTIIILTLFIFMVVKNKVPVFLNNSWAGWGAVITAGIFSLVIAAGMIRELIRRE